MPKKRSPEITAWVPPSQDCPTITMHRIKIEELDDPCARDVVAEILMEKLGNTSWTFDFFTTPVRLEVKRGDKPSKVYEWKPDDFPCLSTFLDDIRSGLPEFDRSKFLESIESSMASIIEQVRNTCVRHRIEDIEIPRMPSEADLVIERFRATLGLEGLKQPSRRLANLRELDMRSISSSERGPIRIARWLHQVEALEKVILK